MMGISDNALEYIWDRIDKDGRLQPGEKATLADNEGVSEWKIRYIVKTMRAIKLYGVEDAKNHLTDEDLRRTKYVFTWFEAKAKATPLTMDSDDKEELKEQIKLLIKRETTNISILRKLLTQLEK